MAVVYDVAFSFLSSDEHLARKYSQELVGSLSVFVYSEQQKVVAGTDGLESFRNVFLSGSRLVVVLYRDGWGATPWTRVEETAIKDRFLAHGAEFLLFVMLEEQSKVPAWLPHTRVRLNVWDFGDQLIGAIKARAIAAGSELKVESAVDKAKRLKELKIGRDERMQKLTNDGWAGFHQEWDTLCKIVSEKVTEVRVHLPTIRNGVGEGGYVVRTPEASVLFCHRPSSRAFQSHVSVQTFVGPLILPAEQGNRMHIPGEEPQRTSEHNFYFDYDSGEWCWRIDQSKDRFISTAELGELILKTMIEHQEKVETGKVSRRHYPGRTKQTWME
jgi:hypothetical protein